MKETEKALRALQQNKLDNPQQYLVHVLTIDPNFADGLSHGSVAATPQRVREGRRLSAKIAEAFPEPHRRSARPGRGPVS